MNRVKGEEGVRTEINRATPNVILRVFMLLKPGGTFEFDFPLAFAIFRMNASISSCSCVKTDKQTFEFVVSLVWATSCQKTDDTFVFDFLLAWRILG